MTPASLGNARNPPGHFPMLTRVLIELAMKHCSCERWWEPVFIGAPGYIPPAVDNPGVQHHLADPKCSPVVLGHEADCLVTIAVHLEILPRRQEEVREHVAA